MISRNSIKNDRTLARRAWSYVVERVLDGRNFLASLASKPSQLLLLNQNRKLSKFTRRNIFRSNLGANFEMLEGRAMMAVTTVFSDNFATSTGASYDTTGAIGASANWSLTRSGTDFGARIDGGILDLTNDATATGNANGWVLGAFDNGALAAPWSSTLSSNPGQVTWEFNMRQIRTDPAGFGSGSYGVGFILAGTSATAFNAGTGYAVVLGQSGNTDNVRLVAYSGGLSGTLTNVVVGDTDFGLDFLSIRVTYLPSTNTWELFVRNDGTTSFTDPTAGTSLTSQGTGVNSAFTSTANSRFTGGYWSGSTAASQTAFFDNVFLKVDTPSTPTITGAATAAPFTTIYGTASAPQTFAIGGTDLGSSVITATAPTGFEVSSNNGASYGSTADFTPSGGTVSGNLLVRLRNNAAVSGSYNSANIVLSSLAVGATSVNITTASSGNSVAPAALSITANDVTKSQGSALTGGAGSIAFTSSGLVLSQTIGTVTITYGSGAEAGALAGTYTGSVIASAPTGGTFTASNYTITFVAGNIVVTADPTITVTGTLLPFSTTYGTATVAQSFSVSGGFLTGDLTVTAPSGYEISLTSGSGYASSIVLPAISNTVASTPIFVRIPATTSAGTPSGNVTIGGGAPTVSVAASGIVATKTLTVTGLTAVGKEYDRLLTATVTGTPTFVGLENLESFTPSPALTWTYSTVAVGINKPLLPSGTYSAPSSNYTVTQPSLTTTITAKALTVIGAVVSAKVFDNTTAATITSASLEGIISPDNVSILASTGTFADVNAGTAKPVTAAITITGGDAGNYTVTQPTGLTGDITQASQTITFGALPTVSTATNTVTLPLNSSAGLPISYTSSNTTVATVAGNTMTILSAGTTTVTATQAGNSNVLAATSVQQTQTVTAAPATWNFGTTALNASPAAVPTSILISPIARGNNNGNSTASPFDTTSASTGYTNSTTVVASGQFNAGAAAMGGTFNAATSTYFEFTITPVSGFSADVSSVNFGSRSTGSGPTSLSVRSSADNYAASLATMTVPTTGTWQFLTPSFAPVSSVAPLTFRIYASGGSAAAAPANLLSPNWRIDDLQVTATATLLSSPTISVTAQSATYTGLAYAGASSSVSNAGSPAPVVSFTYYAGPTATGTPVTPINVGQYTVVASSPANLGNNAATSAPVTFDITPAPLTITAEAKSKAFGAFDPALTYTTSAFVPGETASIALSGALSRVAGEAPGTYAIEQGSVTAVNGNYAITYQGALLTIAAAPAPTFTGASVNGGDTFLNNAQRSQITSLVLNFSAPVVVAANAFTVANVGLFSAQTAAALASSQILVTGSGTNQITLRWGTGSGVQARSLIDGALGNSLMDGNWQLTIDPSKITTGGTAMTGNTTFGTLASDNFFRMYGDSNGDGTVNAIDRANFMSALGGVHNAALDFDGNGSTTIGVDSTNYFANNGKRRRRF